jgi:hypothetical protein
MNWSNKLEHYITLGQQGLPMTDTFAHSYVMKKMTYSGGEIAKLFSLSNTVKMRYLCQVKMVDFQHTCLISSHLSLFYKSG